MIKQGKVVVVSKTRTTTAGARPTNITANTNKIPIVKSHTIKPKKRIPNTTQPEPTTDNTDTVPATIDLPEFSQFKLDDDPVYKRVFEYEAQQHSGDVLMDETPTRPKTRTGTTAASTGRGGALIKLRAQPGVGESLKIRAIEQQLKIPIFRGLPDSECLPVSGELNIKNVNFDSIPAFCLHLPERRDRQPFMIENLPKIHSNVKCIPGIKFEPSYKAISRAHKQIIAIAKAKGWPFVITIEDDIKIPSLKAKAAFMSAIQHLPDDWDALLGGVYDCKSYNYIGNDLAEVKGWCSLHLVLWRHTIYDDILNHSEAYHIDRYIGALTNRKFYMTWPFVAVQYNGFSDNVSMDVNYDKWLSRFKILK